MSNFISAFETFRACGIAAQVFDEEQKLVTLRQSLNGGFHLDGISRLAAISINPVGLVSVCGPIATPLGYYVSSNVGSTPNDAPQYQDETSKMYFTIFRATERLPKGHYSVRDDHDRLFTISVNGDKPDSLLRVPPTPGLRWIRELSPVFPAPLLPSWANQVCWGINVRP